MLSGPLRYVPHHRRPRLLSLRLGCRQRRSKSYRARSARTLVTAALLRKVRHGGPKATSLISTPSPPDLRAHYAWRAVKGAAHRVFPGACPLCCQPVALDRLAAALTRT